jgi:hypothetical protein
MGLLLAILLTSIITVALFTRADALLNIHCGFVLHYTSNIDFIFDLLFLFVRVSGINRVKNIYHYYNATPRTF